MKDILFCHGPNKHPAQTGSQEKKERNKNETYPTQCLSQAFERKAAKVQTDLSEISGRGVVKRAPCLY